MINILADEYCKFRVDVTQKYRLQLLNVLGMYSVDILDEDDYVVYQGAKIALTNFPIVNPYNLDILKLINDSVGQPVLTYDPDDDSYNDPFDDMSIHVRYLLGKYGERIMPDGTVDKGKGKPFNMGSPFIFVISDNAISPMMYVWQQDGEDPYARTKNIVSINLNSFQSNCPFSLQGNEFILDTSFTGDLTFKIVGLLGEDIKINNNVLWQFALMKA
jgi:hypothetical protein